RLEWMEDIAETLSWPFRDRFWLPKTFLQGLILLIPVLGPIALLAWMMESLDHLRAGRDELAPAALRLRRGWPIFAVEVAYCAVIAIVGLVLATAGADHRRVFVLGQLWDV